MCRTNKSLVAYHLLSVVVYLPCLVLHILGCHNGGAHLLVAVFSKLLLERRERVETCIESSSHLEFIVHKQWHILFHRCLLDYLVTVILVVRILKLRPRHILTVYGHHDGVGCLCPRRNGEGT